MAINWCFNEPWMTAAGNNLLAYPAIPRSSYYAVQSALRTAMFSARIPKFSWRAGETFEAELWLLHDGNAPLEGVVSAVLQVGEVCVDLLEWRASAEVRSNTQGPTLRWILPNVDVDRMTLHLQSANGLESSYCLQYRPLANVKIGGSKTMNV
jgi:beta-mannosidase